MVQNMQETANSYKMTTYSYYALCNFIHRHLSSMHSLIISVMIGQYSSEKNLINKVVHFLICLLTCNNKIFF